MIEYLQVTGLHCNGYGLLLRQSTFSASVMYAMWVSMGRSRDPFMIVPGIPLKEEFRQKWSRKRIREVSNIQYLYIEVTCMIFTPQ